MALIKTQVYLDPTTHAELRRLAARQHRSISQVAAMKLREAFGVLVAAVLADVEPEGVSIYSEPYPRASSANDRMAEHDLPRLDPSPPAPKIADKPIKKRTGLCPHRLPPTSFCHVCDA